MQRKPRLASPFGSRGEDGHGHRKRKGRQGRLPAHRRRRGAQRRLHPPPAPPASTRLPVRRSRLSCALRWVLMLVCLLALLGFDGLRRAKRLGFLLDREYGVRIRILRRFLHSDSVNSSFLCAALFYPATPWFR